MLAPAADTAGIYLVPRQTTSGQRCCYMEATGGGELGRIVGGWGRRCRSCGGRSREDPASLALADVMTVEAVAAPGETTVEVDARGRKQSAVVLLWLVVGPRVDAVGRRVTHGDFGDHHRDPARCDGAGRVR
jgi:hypothetical protein